MKYMAMIYARPEDSPEFGSPGWDQLMVEYQAAEAAYEKAGIGYTGEALQDGVTATTLKVRGGSVETMDGPFAVTKEELGGFYVFDCENLDEAIRYAAMIPSAKYGAVELRPVIEFEG